VTSLHWQPEDGCRERGNRDDDLAAAEASLVTAENICLQNPRDFYALRLVRSYHQLQAKLL